jgi:hypothetical protein
MSDPKPWDAGYADGLAAGHTAPIHSTTRTASPIQQATSKVRPRPAKDGYRTRPATLRPEKSIYRTTGCGFWRELAGAAMMV